MKILITTQTDNKSSEVDQRFGRCPYFAVADTETGEIIFHDNKQNAQGTQGAGIQAGQTVASLGAEYVLTGHCGPNAFRTLKAANIKVITGVSGNLESAIDKFKNGDYKAADNPDVVGHW